MWWNNEKNTRRKYSTKAGRGQQRVQDRARPACCGAGLALRHRYCPSVSNFYLFQGKVIMPVKYHI